MGQQVEAGFRPLDNRLCDFVSHERRHPRGNKHQYIPNSALPPLVHPDPMPFRFLLSPYSAVYLPAMRRREPTFAKRDFAFFQQFHEIGP